MMKRKKAEASLSIIVTIRENGIITPLEHSQSFVLGAGERERDGGDDREGEGGGSADN